MNYRNYTWTQFDAIKFQDPSVIIDITYTYILLIIYEYYARANNEIPIYSIKWRGKCGQLAWMQICPKSPNFRANFFIFRIKQLF